MRRKIRKFLPSVLVGFVLGILLQLIWPFVFYQSEAEKLQEFLLSQDTIYWQVESSRAQDKRVTTTIQNILNSTQGWTRAGITFEQNSLSEPSVVFVLHNQDESENVCRTPTAVGCMRREAHLCKVLFLEADLFREQRATLIINHEVGHCLGIPHSKHGLMVRDNPFEHPYPDESDIARIRTLRERLHSPN